MLMIHKVYKVRTSMYVSLTSKLAKSELLWVTECTDTVALAVLYWDYWMKWLVATQRLLPNLPVASLSLQACILRLSYASC